MDSENLYDVIIVGAGPAGATTALFLEKQGKKVLLLDKATFPRDKTCGDAISGKSMGVLKELGLVDEIAKNPHFKTYGVLFSSPKGDVASIEFPENRTGKGYGFVCRREIFDNALFNQVKKTNVEIILGFNVTDVLMDGEKFSGIKGKIAGEEKEFHGKILIGADGANSVLANKLGVRNVDPKHWLVSTRAYYSNVKNMTDKIEIHFVDSFMPGYFWIFPEANGTANIGVGMVMTDFRKKKMNMTKEMFRLIEEEPLFKERFKDAKMEEGTLKGWNLPVGSTHIKSYGNGVLLTGDAASLIDPFTGEGVGNAMTSGKYAAKWAGKAIDENNFSEEFLAGYDKELWEEIGSELKTSYMMQKLGKVRPLLNWLIGKAARNKEVAEMLSATLANEEAKKEFTSPMFYLKLLFS